MDSCIIEISDSDLKNKKIRVASCGREFFPDDAFGDSSSKKGKSGKEITLLVEGFEKPVTTDIPTDKKIFRSRSWVKEFFQQNEIKPKDKLKIERLSARKYKIEVNKKLFTFVDLFSGIGGFRIPLEKLGGKCLGFSEIDNDAIDIYKNNFLDIFDNTEKELGDIKYLEKLPFDVDLIVGGVPCQSWSIAGMKRGFNDPRGKLWLDAIRIISCNKPKAFIFENVKGLKDPRNKNSLEFLVNKLEEINYDVQCKLLNSYDFGLPQNRERIFIVGIRRDIELIKDFAFPKPLEAKPKLYNFIDNLNTSQEIEKKNFSPNELFGDKIPASRNKFQKYNQLNDFFIFCDTRNGHTTIHSWEIINTTQREKEICMTILKNRRKKIYGPLDGNPIPFEVLNQFIKDLKESELLKLVDKKILRKVKEKGYEFVNSKNSSGINGVYRIFLPHSNIFSTLTATGTKDMVALESIKEASPKIYKQEFLNYIVHENKYRPINAREAARLQGFPDNFVFHKNEKKALKQFGNAVSTNVIFYLAKSLIETGVFK